MKPCPFCGAEGKHEYDYVRGCSMKHHYVVCTQNQYHIGGIGCYNQAPGKNSSNKCDYCHKHDVTCVFAEKEWDKRV